MDRARRQNISSGTPWEAKVGYSRAVRIGNQVFVSGTTAMKDGQLVGGGDAAAQTRQILTNIEWALNQAGAAMRDVVRYRVYLTNITDWPDVAEELAKAFGEVRPANTLVAINALVMPEMVVEIEADAVVP